MPPQQQRRNTRKQLTPEEQAVVARERTNAAISAWIPKTDYGKAVKAGQVTDIMDVLQSEKKILEPEVIDALVPDLQSDLLIVGQSKGKFGGGAGRIFRQTQKKTREGNKPSFSTCAIVGNKDGIIGMGIGKAKETVPAREKAARLAKLNVIAIPRGSGDWESQSTQPHTLPFAVEGKCGSVTLKLMPAPIGTGLVVHPECKKILELAGIKNVWSKISGHTPTKSNVLKACFAALENLSKMRIREQDYKRLNIVVGPTVQTGTLIKTLNEGKKAPEGETA